MRLLAFIIAMSLQTTIVAQSSVVDIYNDHHFPCDSGVTSLEINLCTGEKADFADSLLNKVYYKIIKELDKQIASYSATISPKTGKKFDSSEIKFAIEQRKLNVRIKQNLVKSQQQWLKTRSADCELQRCMCEGGSGCIGIVNDLYIRETLSRITQLEEFSSD